MKSLLIESLRKQKATKGFSERGVPIPIKGTSPLPGELKRAIRHEESHQIAHQQEIRSMEQQLACKDDTIDLLKNELAKQDHHISDLEEKNAFLTDYSKNLEGKNTELRQELERLKKSLTQVTEVNRKLAGNQGLGQDPHGVEHFYPVCIPYDHSQSV